MTHAATLLAGRYVLDEPIGSGGYCEVWRATDTVLTRPVAVKLLHPGYASQGEALARFKAEARHAGALSHENVARVYDYGEPVDGQSYLVMELIDGPSLADRLARGPLGAEATMDLVAQAAAGLQAAHSAGVIHRDIKPANILFTPEGGVRITDFGIAHAVGSAPVTSTGMVMGTPGYIAPERVSGGQVGPASDLYALGVVAYECLSGAQPFRGGALEVAIAHRDRPLPPLPLSVPAEVTDFVMMLTAKDPFWRPASAGEVADQAARLRDGLLAGKYRGRPARGAVPAGPTMAGPSLTAGPSTAGPLSTSADDLPPRPRRWRPLAIAVLTLAAVTCLLLITVTGFASGSPSHAPSRSAPAATGSPAAAGTGSSAGTTPASRTASSSAAGSASASPSSSPRPTTSSSSAETGTSQGHHKKSHGNGNGHGNGNS